MNLGHGYHLHPGRLVYQAAMCSIVTVESWVLLDIGTRAAALWWMMDEVRVDQPAWALLATAAVGILGGIATALMLDAADLLVWLWTGLMGCALFARFTLWGG